MCDYENMGLKLLYKAMSFSLGHVAILFGKPSLILYTKFVCIKLGVTCIF